MDYLHWKEIKIDDFSSENITRLYNEGFVFTRKGKGIMHQTRSVRINLSRFELSSENRRILKKMSDILLKVMWIPRDVESCYDWRIHKMGFEFYKEKFGENIFTANKIKSLLLDDESNFNRLFTYSNETALSQDPRPRGYAICYMNEHILHYSYPFYDLKDSPKDMGLGMMTLALEHAKKEGLAYVYLGSLQRPADVYKLQFAGLEWFDGTAWSSDIDKVKEILKQSEIK